MTRYNDILDKIWEKAIVVENYDPNRFRKDSCGAWIVKEKYNCRDSDFGWEVDHIYPQAKLELNGASLEEIDMIDNLRPMNWHNNVSKGTDYPIYKASVTSKDNTNIEKNDEYEVNKEIQNSIKQLYSKYI